MKLIAFFFFAVLIMSCQQETIIIPDTGRKIVINSLFASDSLAGVFLTNSMYISDSSMWLDVNYLEDASVKVFENERLLDSLTFEKRFGMLNGLFISQNNYRSYYYRPIPGNHYKIVVNAPGMPEATAETTIPNVVKIERVDSSRIILANQSSWLSNIDMVFKVFFTDPAKEKNYYLFCVFEGKTSIRTRSSGLIIENITFQDPVVEEDLDHGTERFGIAFSDKSINGKQHEIMVTINGSAIDFPSKSSNSSYSVYRTVLYFKLYSITEGYFKYIQTLNLFLKNYNNPLDAPSQVYSNIQGGYGIFEGAAVSCDSIVFQ
jgi:hypothetical protein